MAQYQLPPQSFTPDVTTPPKGTLLAKYKGAPVTSVRTPALFIDQAVFKRNCARMHSSVKAWGASFRAHVKTHKTVEGVRLQLQSGAGTTTAVVVSTIMEAWEIVRGGLVQDGTVDDILYGLPVAPSKLADLAKLEHAMQTVNPNACLRLMIDNIYQVRALESYGEKVWSTFVKVDHGGHRAGLPVGSDALRELVTTMIESPSVHIHGFYCHAGDSYASTTLHQASSFLTVEMHAVDAAATMALSILEARPEINSSKYKKPFVLSVGSTPTAHTTHLVSSPADALAQEFTSGGVLEIHAGNYPVCDLQQLHTGLIGLGDVAHRVLASVISAYPARGEGGVDEAMCDAGGIAMSRDTGPSGGFGDVVPWVTSSGESGVQGNYGMLEDGSVKCDWRLGRCSQEHGILTRSKTNPQASSSPLLTPGEHIWIIGQHACLTLAAYPWYYIVDSDAPGGLETVMDVWVPWKGW